MADRTSPPRVSSASFKTTARRKTVRITPAKDKEKTSEAQKDGESPPPDAQSTAPLEEKDEQDKRDENKETPEAVEPEPEPPYPYLTLKELPALDQPLRPLSHLCALPLKDGPSSPPPAEDSVTFIHVLERSERLTQDGRDEATRRAVSYLCNDGPGTMLLVARWLDSVADAVENNTVASSEKFPWREVIPPLFVGINKHRELLSSKMPRTQFSPKELREFLETEGFIETQGQKLQHLLETKGIPGKGSEAGAGRPDLVSSYFERMAPKQQQASAAVRVNSSTPDKGTPRSPPSAESPGGEGGSPPSSPGGTQPEQESTPYADEASRSPIREGEAAREEHKGKDGEEYPSEVASSSSRTPV
ncbi:uncharacterized protein EMH_0020760 [Eimeria mitis]|uniref:Uncharacterized protein n=1 Tax=Eimeria mitis TaxID=44415 RepID=U6KE63_9EIME|nr:uncharacterized protein EMH_0020760 [Eimeria mitis]CDJ34527.1 hypothetical protein EMH_0020760 [Eimeria mitis]